MTLLQPIPAPGLEMLCVLSVSAFFCSIFSGCSVLHFSLGRVCVRALARARLCAVGGVALLLQSSLSARFFNFTAHFPLMSFSHTHPLYGQ